MLRNCLMILVFRVFYLFYEKTPKLTKDFFVFFQLLELIISIKIIPESCNELKPNKKVSSYDKPRES